MSVASSFASPLDDGCAAAVALDVVLPTAAIHVEELEAATPVVAWCVSAARGQLDLSSYWSIKDDMSLSRVKFCARNSNRSVISKSTTARAATPVPYSMKFNT